LRDVVSLHLDNSLAEVSGTLIIDLQFTHELIIFFQENPLLGLALTFNRENTIALPLSVNSSNESEDEVEMEIEHL
jgi:hypothetical protein